MGCQFKIANQIVKAKGDYVLALKGSQGECFDDVQLFLNSQLEKTEEKRYFISNHSDKDAEFIAHAIRSHWHVENKLHWQLDISFNEDSLRLRSGHAAQNIALLNKLALNLLKNETSTKVGVKSKRLKAVWDNDYMMKVLNVGCLTV
ncbi:MAG: putative transposase YbfD/YdcC [Paraglaciecola sp.]|jgi:predicted transposase YbfD/YdcC